LPLFEKTRKFLIKQLKKDFKSNYASVNDAKKIALNEFVKRPLAIKFHAWK